MQNYKILCRLALIYYVCKLLIFVNVEVVKSKNKIIEIISQYKSSQNKTGFVPTMGALHKGHISLVKRALSENDIVFVSIFVNPTQFDNKQDLEKYPRTLERDVELLKIVSKDKIVVYSPIMRWVALVLDCYHLVRILYR